jgi:hypothetical protein
MDTKEYYQNKKADSSFLASQDRLLKEVAEVCESGPGEIVYAIYSSFKSEAGEIEYVSDFVIAHLESEEVFLQSQAPFFSAAEITKAKKMYQQSLKDHYQNLDSLVGKFDTMSVEELFEILKEQNATLKK